MGKSLLNSLKWQLQVGYESLNIARQIKQLFYIMYRYFIVYDWDNGTIHSKVFNDLYLLSTVKAYNEIAEENNIHERTLNRYITKYNELAKRIIINKFPMLKEIYISFFIKKS